MSSHTFFTPFRAFAASLAQWGFVGLWLPYNHLAHNICELVVLGMQTLTLALPVLGHAGGLSWREVGNDDVVHKDHLTS